jgi:hypothetical protein
MNILSRVKNILTTPKTEWPVINQEKTSVPDLLSGYVIILVGLASIASFIGQGFIGTSFMGIKVGGTLKYGLYSGVTTFVAGIISFYLVTYIIDFLAPKFKSEQNLTKSAQLVAFSYTASWIGGLLAVIPILSWLGILFGFYGLYLMYLGLPAMKNTPEDQRIPYLVVTILVVIVISIVVRLLLTTVLGGVFGFKGMG